MKDLKRLAKPVKELIHELIHGAESAIASAYPEHTESERTVMVGEYYERIIKELLGNLDRPSFKRDYASLFRKYGYLKGDIDVIAKKLEKQKLHEAERDIEVKGARFDSSPDGGLVAIDYYSDNGEIKEARTVIGNHLKAVAKVDSVTADSSGIHLEFQTFEDQTRYWTMPRALLSGQESELLSALLARKYNFERSKKSKLLDYLQGLGKDLDAEYRLSDKTGWTDGSFVLHEKTYGNSFLRFREIEPTPDTSLIHCQGTLEGWKTDVAAQCQGNSRLIFALGTAFAAPLLPVAGLESGGFHLAGATSAGKTTTFKVAASVAGLKEIPLWNSTANGLESTATAFNHLCLPLDEIKQCDPREVGKIAYMLGNGAGKTRMKRNLTRSTPNSWQLLYLSAGEALMREHLNQAGIRVAGGQEVRMPDIPALPNDSSYGVFETIGDYTEPARFASDLETAAKSNCGWALDAYLTQLVESRREDPEFDRSLRERLFERAGLLVGGERDAAICRVSKRFALVLIALELAHDYGLLPFSVEQSQWAVQTLFIDWINARGGAGSIEIKQALERIEHLFASNEHSDRIFRVVLDPDGKEIETTPTVKNLLAYCKPDFLTGKNEFLLPSPIFNKEIVGDVDRKTLIRELQRKGWLKGPGTDGKNTLQRHCQKKKQRFYVFSHFWQEDTETEEQTQTQLSNLQKQGGTGGTGGTDNQMSIPEAVSGVLPLSHPPNSSGGTGETDSSERKLSNSKNGTGVLAVPPVPPPSHPEVGQQENAEKYIEEEIEGPVPPVPPVPPQKQEREESDRVSFSKGDKQKKDDLGQRRERLNEF